MSNEDDDSIPEPEYEEEEFVLGGISLSITTIAYLPIELLMANRSKDTEISGQKLWCGSLGVLQYILNNTQQVLLQCPTTVVELGAGTGVLGMMCRKLGAAEIFLTDHDSKSIEHMRRDCSTNDLDECRVVELDWFNPIMPTSIFSTRNRLLIVAGDVLYKHVLLEPFFTTLNLILTSYTGDSVPYVLLCHIPRAGVEQSDVVSKAQSFDFTVENIPEEQWKGGESYQYCDPDDLERAQLYSLRKM